MLPKSKGGSTAMRPRTYRARAQLNSLYVKASISTTPAIGTARFGPIRATIHAL